MSSRYLFNLSAGINGQTDGAGTKKRKKKQKKTPFSISLLSDCVTLCAVVRVALFSFDMSFTKLFFVLLFFLSDPLLI